MEGLGAWLHGQVPRRVRTPSSGPEPYCTSAGWISTMAPGRHPRVHVVAPTVPGVPVTVLHLVEAVAVTDGEMGAVGPIPDFRGTWACVSRKTGFDLGKRSKRKAGRTR